MLLAEHHAMEACWGVEVWLHSFFDLGTGWGWVVGFLPRPLCPWAARLWCLLDGRLGEPQYCYLLGKKYKYPSLSVTIIYTLI